MKRLLLTSLLLITFIGNVLADDVTFVASAPKSVVVNQRFKLTYTVNTTDAKEPVIGEIPGFELLHLSDGVADCHVRNAVGRVTDILYSW